MSRILSAIRNWNSKRIRNLQEKNNLLDSTCTIQPHVSIRDSKVGYYSGINQNSVVAYTSIGNYTQLGSWVRTAPRDHIYENFMIGDWIYQNNEHCVNMEIEGFDEYWVKIGHDVWIGDRSIILSRVEIGNGAIIAAGSVVTKSVPAYAVVGGAPAKFIKWRFEPDIIEKLISSDWYGWEIDRVIENSSYLQKLVKFDLSIYQDKMCRKRSMIDTER